MKVSQASYTKNNKRFKENNNNKKKNKKKTKKTTVQYKETFEYELNGWEE